MRITHLPVAFRHGFITTMGKQARDNAWAMFPWPMRVGVSSLMED
jgi:hypothetical protein